MRHIGQERVRQDLPDGWPDRAQRAEAAVAIADPDDRSDAVNRHSDVWRDLKVTLRTASHGKCWYCESIEIRSDNAVDHFRPKNAVAECHDHNGYWWLAFDWRNHRFCCTYCNSRRIDQATELGGGKAGHFPLKDEAHRARTPNDALDAEEPVLLDPTVAADPGLLWFDESGEVAPHPICGHSDRYTHLRATTSIELYHLNHQYLVEQRKALCSVIRRHVEEADAYFSKYLDGDATAQGAFGATIEDLRGPTPEGRSIHRNGKGDAHGAPWYAPYRRRHSCSIVAAVATGWELT